VIVGIVYGARMLMGSGLIPITTNSRVSLDTTMAQLERIGYERRAREYVRSFTVGQMSHPSGIVLMRANGRGQVGARANLIPKTSSRRELRTARVRAALLAFMIDYHHGRPSAEALNSYHSALFRLVSPDDYEFYSVTFLRDSKTGFCYAIADRSTRARQLIQTLKKSGQ
jgi:hypothetical protein